MTTGIVAAAIEPDAADIATGLTSFQAASAYTGFTGPTSFGNGGFTLASSGSGNTVGLVSSLNSLAVPAGYISGSPLSDTSTYSDQTFTSLGVTPGTYKWIWGSGANQNFTLDIVAAAVPEPSSLLLLALPLGFVLLLAARSRRAARPA